MSYSNTIKEEELKNKVAKDFFEKFDNTKIIGNIDFCIAEYNRVEDQTRSFLWAESKKGNKHNLYESIVQLILTVGRARTFEKFMPPAFLGAFDAEKIAFIQYHVINEVFFMNDFNWNVTPSNHETKEFKYLYELVKSSFEKNLLLFKFGEDDESLRNFIKNNFINGKSLTKFDITKNNFASVYFHWLKEVKPSISNVNWEEVKQYGILDADFYLADILSSDNVTIKDKLYVLLKNNVYEYDEHFQQGRLFVSRASFNDGQKAHNQFWNKYNRPPKEEFWDYILKRRDLLVPQDIRERKGSYFTPQRWVELSQRYMADCFGENWQEEYYIWDCAAGTGNLLVGLNEPYRIWASTIDQADVDVMKDRIKNGNANLLESHVFQFDFLNDNFSKCPAELQKILNDEEKRKKLIIYINPPYAEATTKTTVVGTGENKTGVARSQIYTRYQDRIGAAVGELFAQFLIRIFFEISGCKIVQFSTLKTVQSYNFNKFREVFTAQLEKLFLVPAYTFDNVKGQFPIGLFIWDSDKIRETYEYIMADVYDENANFIGIKTIYNYDLSKSLVEWQHLFYDKNNESIGLVHLHVPDIQNNNGVFIASLLSSGVIKKKMFAAITCNNIIEFSIYYTIRHVIEASWLNDRDHYVYPLPSWDVDKIFKTDCFAYALFNNNIQSEHGINHWIPFTEKEVCAKDAFESHFMTDYINGKLKPKVSSKATQGNLVKDDTQSRLPAKPLIFSDEAKAVFDAGRELWRYYHTQPDANPNAALYDIKEYFQGRNEKGRMNNTSNDERYNALMDDLKDKLRILAFKIVPKVYEHGFLKKIRQEAAG